MVVVDSSALIPLIKTGKLGLLRKVFARIVIPEPVWQEVAVEGKALGKPVRGLEEGKGKWFTVAKPKREISAAEGTLTKNDLAVFEIAKANADVLLTNDASLYYYALSQSVKAYWLTTVVLIAAKKRKVTKSEAENTLLELVSTGGMRLKSDVLSELLMMIRNLH